MKMRSLACQKRVCFGFTLLEILIAFSVLVFLSIPLIVKYNSIRRVRALSVSAEEVANVARMAHVFSRDARNSRAWGIKT